MEIDSLRSKLLEEEISHKKLQEQFLTEKLKRVGTQNSSEEEIKNDSQEIVRGNILSSSSFIIPFLLIDLERKLDAERVSLKRANEELIQSQKKVRMLEMDLKQITNNYNQLIYDHELSKQSNEQIIERMESDHQRRSQYDKDLKQLQQQFQNALNKEKQLNNELNQMRKENERLHDELRLSNQEYENLKSKLIDYEEQVEGKTKAMTWKKTIVLGIFSRK